MQWINVALICISVNNIARWEVEAKNQSLCSYFIPFSSHTTTTPNRHRGVPNHCREMGCFVMPNGCRLMIKKVATIFSVPLRDYSSRLNERFLNSWFYSCPTGPEVLTKTGSNCEKLFVKVFGALVWTKKFRFCYQLKLIICDLNGITVALELSYLHQIYVLGKRVRPSMTLSVAVVLLNYRLAEGEISAVHYQCFGNFQNG